MGERINDVINHAHLPRKQVLEEMADKQKAVPEEADLVPPGDCFCCFIVISELENVVNL